jgi:predicted transcriptional regulator
MVNNLEGLIALILHRREQARLEGLDVSVNILTEILDEATQLNTEDRKSLDALEKYYEKFRNCFVDKGEYKSNHLNNWNKLILEKLNGDKAAKDKALTEANEKLVNCKGPWSEKEKCRRAFNDRIIKCMKGDRCDD